MKFNPNRKIPRPPGHLSESSKRFFRQVNEQFKLEEHHLKLLTAACEALDRATEAREAVSRDGAYQHGRFGEIKKHPGLTVERDSLTLFTRCLREIGLDLAVEAPRPPIVQGRNNA